MAANELSAEELQQRRERHDSEMAQIRQSIDESIARTSKVRRESSWYPFVAGAVVVGAAVALAKLWS